MSRFGLITKRCKAPNEFELECYKKQYIDNHTSVAIFGRKHGGEGVYLQVFDKKIKWYKLVYNYVMED